MFKRINRIFGDFLLISRFTDCELIKLNMGINVRCVFTSPPLTSISFRGDSNLLSNLEDASATVYLGVVNIILGACCWFSCRLEARVLAHVLAINTVDKIFRSLGHRR